MFEGLMPARRRRDPEVSARVTRVLRPPEDPVSSGKWAVTAPVTSREDADRRRGWVPATSAVDVPAEPERELDDLDLFLASQGLDGLTGVDDWAVDDEPAARSSWWDRLSVPWRAVVLVAISSVIVIAVQGFRVISASRANASVPGTAVPARTSGSTATSTATLGVPPSATSGLASAGSSTAPTSSPSVVWVHVVGQVNKPGVVRLPAGSRVADAVKAAGGARRSADLERVNLARLVVDGEQVFVPRPGEDVVAQQGGASPTSSAGSNGNSSSGSGLVNLNTADASALDSLPGVGPVLAQRILDYRSTHGKFGTVEELTDVPGIGDKLMAQLRPKVTV